MKCNQCDSATINGVFCHESGCPNIGKRWNEEDQEFQEVYTCAECGSEYSEIESLESCCQFDNFEDEDLEEES